MSSNETRKKILEVKNLDLFSRLFFDASPVKIPGYRTFGNSRQFCNISHCQLFSHDAFPFLFKNPGEFLRPPGLI